MTPEALRLLVEQGESLDVEFKGEAQRPLSDTDIVEAVVFSNRTRPSLSVMVHIVIIDDKPVLAVEVPASDVPIGTADGRYLRRAIGGDGRPACPTARPAGRVRLPRPEG